MANKEAQDSPGQGLGRNDRCHCDSGKKYKQCCLAADEAAAREVRAKQAEEAAAAAEAAGDSEEEESTDHHRKTKRPVTHQPWKRDSSNAPSVQKRTLPRKVGS
jgi:hypothetical protein